MHVETLAADADAVPAAWLREQIDALCARGVQGPLYIFLHRPLDAALADTIGDQSGARRPQPIVIAEAAAVASAAQLELLRQARVRNIYITLHGASADAHDARTGDPGSWKRALTVLTSAARLGQHLQVGAHLSLTIESAGELPGLLKLLRHVNSNELLLWDTGSGGLEGTPLDASTALRVLDYAVTSAPKLRLRIRPVGFERTATAIAPLKDEPCIASSTIVDLLRGGVPLPSARAGMYALHGANLGISDIAPHGRALRQLAFELAARGSPLVDLPACLGGPPPERARATSADQKVEACRACPIDKRCAGVASSLLALPGLREEIQPPPHWLPVIAPAHVLLLCPVVTDELYGATFFSLARALVEAGARVDVVTPWSVHPAIADSFGEHQALGRPQAGSVADAFIANTDLHTYDLVVTPDLHNAHALLAKNRLRPGARLAATDFHMLWGMDDWVRDLCPSERRPEEGGWWPSPQVVLYSAFPGYARLYTRYGIPMEQVAWQPYALDTDSFPATLAAEEAASIISAGYHLRDLDTLIAAAALLPAAVHPIDLFAPDQADEVPTHIRWQGPVPSSTFCPAVGRSRFMIVPLAEDPHKAAGITAMATAIQCGRPIVATSTAAARDYVVDGVNGLLVPGRDARALADAITRLDTDHALLTQLAAGARRMAQRLSTKAWARALLHGSRMHEAEHWMWRS